MRCSISPWTAKVEGWTVDLDRLDEAAERTAAVTREAYPDLDIPFHARWRHFVAGETAFPDGADPAALARARFDLVILSVLLDAGAGPDWRYRDPATGRIYTRSEGLAVASQYLFEAGVLSMSRTRFGSRARGWRRWMPASCRRLPGRARPTRCSGWKAAPPCSAASARRYWRGRTCSRPATSPGPAAFTTCWPRAPKADGCRPRPYSSFCSKRSGRSGPTGW